jgi:hypothetical protein
MMSISGSGGRSELDTASHVVAQMPTSGMGQKAEVSGPARHVRFTLRSRYRQPAPACPFGAKGRQRALRQGSALFDHLVGAK